MARLPLNTPSIEKPVLNAKSEATEAKKMPSPRNRGEGISA